MGTSYVRQDVTNNIENGNTSDADVLDAEFDRLQSAFAASTGHSHDGTSGEGGPITNLGPAQEVNVSATTLSPATGDVFDLGTISSKLHGVHSIGYFASDALIVGTRASVVSVTVPNPGADVNALRTLGYAEAGDGGAATYKYVASEPAHAGKVQSADGAWWEILPDSNGVNPLQFGASGNGTTDDYTAFSNLKGYIEDVAGGYGWTQGAKNAPLVNLLGKTYVLGTALHIDAPIKMRDGTILFTQNALTGDYGLCLGQDGAGMAVLPQYLEDLYFGISGSLTANQPAALLYIPYTFSAYLKNVNTHAGDGTYRARYGAYLGRYRCWASSVISGRYYGGECALRIGRENDHTSLKVWPTAADHGRVCNLLLCNPAGADIKGDFEHSDGKSNIVITSGTNGSSNIAHAINIHDGYQFNMSNPSLGSGWDEDTTSILLGHDVPGTEGWDQVGDIASDSAVEQVSIEGLYCVSDYMPTCIKANVLTGLEVRRVKWFARGAISFTGGSGTFTASETVTGGTSGATAVVRAVEAGRVYIQSSSGGEFTDGETITGGTSGATGTVDFSAGYKLPKLLELSGSGADVRITSSRNQNTGSLLPSIKTTATNIPMWQRGMSQFSPEIRGDSTAGTFTYSARGGHFYIVDGIAHVTGFVNWTAASGGSGNVELTLSSLIVPRAFERASASIYSAGIGTGITVEGVILTGENTLRLYEANSTTRIAFADLAANGNLHFSIQVALETPE